MMIMTSSYWTRRFTRHTLLGLSATALVLLGYFASPPPDFRHRLSMGAAYAGILFLVACLWLGPWNVLRQRPNPVSSDLRRDLGIWAGILAILHTAVGLTVHLRGRMWMYFFKQFHPLAIQNNKFGAANFLGLASAILFLVLLVISNDISLRALGLQRWKSIQRWTYAAAILAVAHGILFQLVEKRHLPWVLLYTALIATGLAIQLAGFIALRRKRSS